MKKKLVLPLLSAAIAFVLCYLLCCYLPALRLKLAADPLAYLVESARHMAPFKAAVSAVVAGVVGLAVRFFPKKGPGDKGR